MIGSVISLVGIAMAAESEAKHRRLRNVLATRSPRTIEF
jgi:hypothetical protein